MVPCVSVGDVQVAGPLEVAAVLVQAGSIASAQFFVNSSLAPVLLFRKRLKSVAGVLKGIKQHGFTQTRWDALQRYWGSCLSSGPCGPVCTLSPGRVGFPRIFMAFDSGLHRWVLGLRRIWVPGRMLGSGLTLSPRSIRDPEAQTFRILVETSSYRC